MLNQVVLVIEDNEDIQQLVVFNLTKAGFRAACADSGEQALAMLPDLKPDLIVLDWMLPGMSGLEFCRQRRGQGDDTAIIMLTAKGEEQNIVAGLDQGADDYMTKPFSPKVLISRIKSVLRRRQEQDRGKRVEQGGEVIRVGELLVDSGRHEVTAAGQAVTLTPTEFGILAFLASKPGWVFSRQQIIDVVRGHGHIMTPRTIDVQVFGLRKKLGEVGKQVETVRGIGYRLADT